MAPGYLRDSLRGVSTPGAASLTGAAGVLCVEAPSRLGVQFLAPIELPGDVRCRIEGDLAAGYRVMLPEKGMDVNNGSVVGWWRVDPKTGQTIAFGEHGWGQTMTEYLIKSGTIAISCIAGHAIKAASENGEMSGVTVGLCVAFGFFAAYTLTKMGVSVAMQNPYSLLKLVRYKVVYKKTHWFIASLMAFIGGLSIGD